ncbi:TetR/AcrR family transcriptional regulator [Streptomyces sp. NPDC004561]
MNTPSADHSSVPPRALPRGPHRLEPELIAASQRARLLDAMAESVADVGYAGTTVADVLRLAGVSRKTFYELFANKQACFLAAFDHAAQVLAASVNAQPVPAGDVDEQLRAGYAALCSTLASMPNYVRAFAAGAPEVGAAMQDCQAAWREASMSRLKLVYEASVTEAAAGDLPARLPDHVARAIVGAGDALILEHLAAQGPESLDVLIPTLVSVARTLMFAHIDPPAAGRATGH